MDRLTVDKVDVKHLLVCMVYGVFQETGGQVDG